LISAKKSLILSFKISQFAEITFHTELRFNQPVNY
jgi:hypothetical protein